MLPKDGRLPSEKETDMLMLSMTNLKKIEDLERTPADPNRGRSCAAV